MTVRARLDLAIFDAADMTRAPEPDCWLHPEVEVRPSPDRR